MPSFEQDFRGALSATSNRNLPYKIQELRKRQGARQFLPTGTYYGVRADGAIGRLDMDLAPSGQWLVLMITPTWNARSGLDWPEIKAKLDAGEKVEGYMHDYDHGTHRQWGNGRKVVMWKDKR